MLETYLRPLYQLCLADPLAKQVNVTPKKITFLACILGILAAPAIMLSFPLLATLLILASGFLDTLDGSVARIKNSVTEVGSVLDIVSDRIVEFAILLGLFGLDPANRGLLTLFMLGSCYLCVSSFLVVGIFTPNQSKKGFHYSPGLIERAEAFLFFILMIWLPDYFVSLSVLFTSLVLLTTYLRIKQFIQLGRNENA